MTNIMSPKTRDVFLGKLVFILILGILTGWAVNNKIAKDYQQGQQLTEGRYMDQYEEHKAELVDVKGDDTLLCMFVMSIFAGLSFGLYELFGRLFGYFIGKTIDLVMQPKAEVFTDAEF
jgi:hypothetical protein